MNLDMFHHVNAWRYGFPSPTEERAKAEQEVCETPKVTSEWDTMTIKLIGETPLICHAWSDKAKARMGVCHGTNGAA